VQAPAVTGLRATSSRPRGVVGLVTSSGVPRPTTSGVIGLTRKPVALTAIRVKEGLATRLKPSWSLGSANADGPNVRVIADRPTKKPVTIGHCCH